MTLIVSSRFNMRHNWISSGVWTGAGGSSLAVGVAAGARNTSSAKPYLTASSAEK